MAPVMILIANRTVSAIARMASQKKGGAKGKNTNMVLGRSCYFSNGVNLERDPENHVNHAIRTPIMATSPHMELPKNQGP